MPGITCTLWSTWSVAHFTSPGDFTHITYDAHHFLKLGNTRTLQLWQNQPWHLVSYSLHIKWSWICWAKLKHVGNSGKNIQGCHAISKCFLTLHYLAETFRCYIYIYIYGILHLYKRSNAVLHSLAQVLKYDCLGSNSNIILSKLLNLSGSHFSYL